MAQDQRRRPARIVAVIGVHVGAADADRLDLDHDFAVDRGGHGFVAKLERVRTGVDQSTHDGLLLLLYFAMKPPSTARVCPVIYPEASEARNTVAPVRSSSLPLRPIAVCAARR